MTSPWITQKPEGVLVSVRVKPRSSRNQVEAPSADGCLPVKLTAPPVDNKANQALVALLAKKLKVPKSAITIQSGERSRNKLVMISGVKVEEIERILL